MATYKVWFTVRDGYGNIKEVDGGAIDVDLGKLTQGELEQIGSSLDMEDYLKKVEIPSALEEYATDAEVDTALRAKDYIKYSDFEVHDEEDA